MFPDKQKQNDKWLLILKKFVSFRFNRKRQELHFIFSQDNKFEKCDFYVLLLNNARDDEYKSVNSEWYYTQFKAAVVKMVCKY